MRTVIKRAEGLHGAKWITTTNAPLLQCNEGIHLALHCVERVSICQRDASGWLVIVGVEIERL